MIAGRPGRIDPSHPMWAKPLPMPVRRAPAEQAPSAAVTHGIYFQAIQTYLRNEGARHLRAALKTTAAQASPPAIPERIDVILEKHGEFYHPARIRVMSALTTRVLVLNVAATPVGFECMESEIKALAQVAPRLPARSLPRVYGVGRVDGDNGARLQMFLADWFEGFHEFHLAVDPRDGIQKIIVWDTRHQPFFLPRDCTEMVYYQAAHLLARAYDSRTTRQVYPWHHASGDFVLRHANDGVRLKLIAVRQYAPTLGDGDGQRLDDESLLMAAMVFFANLTLRIRIDRLDGTGKMAWADDAAVGATVAGFKRAMSEWPHAALRDLLLSYDEDDWTPLLNAVGAQYRLMPAEEALLDRHIGAHAVCLQAAVRREFRD